MKRYLRADEDKEASEIEKTLPGLTEGQVIPSVDTTVSEHWTKPPAAYTEDSLLAAMERAGNAEMDDDVERKGLGTPATRASIIEKLISGGYVVRRKKQIIPTDAGKQMISVMPEYLKSARMTADWENRLLLMERGVASAESFMDDIYSLIDTVLDGCRRIPEDERSRFEGGRKPDKSGVGSCPICGSTVREGKSNFYCSNKACAFVLWKENRYLSSMRKRVDQKMAADFLARGKTHARDFYSAKTGKTFEADLLMDVSSDGKVSFRMEFPKRADRKKKE